MLTTEHAPKNETLKQRFPLKSFKNTFTGLQIWTNLTKIIAKTGQISFEFRKKYPEKTFRR